MLFAYATLIVALAYDAVAAIGGFRLVPHLASFEGLPSGQIVPGAPTLQGPPVPYLDLVYTQTVVAKNSDLAVDTLKTNQGTQFGATNLGQSPSISANTIADPTNVAFGLDALYAGCYASSMNGDLNPPIDCTISFIGDPLFGSPGTSRRDFVFKTGAPLGIGITSGVLQRVAFRDTEAGIAQFTALKNLRIMVTASTATPALTGIDFDALNYTSIFKK